MMKSRTARIIVGIWLALGTISLASCSPVTPAGASNSSAAQVGSATLEQHFDSNAPVDSAQSQALTDYLHTQRLPLVGARVLAANGGPRQVILYGYVATPFGKADAADRARQFLNDSGAQVDNRLRVEPDLAGNPAGNSAPSARAAENNSPGQNNPDIQKYEDQQTADQQQYMNQGMSPLGGSGIIMMLPLMMGGSFGGGGSSFGFGSGGFGSGFGGGFGSGGFGGFPPPGYGSPYTP